MISAMAGKNISVVHEGHKVNIGVIFPSKFASQIMMFKDICEII